MKSKMLLGVGLGIVVVVAGVAGIVKYSQHKNTQPFEGTVQVREDVSVDTELSAGDVGLIQSSELIAEVADEQEAQEIAELYGITLVRVTEGLAVYETEESPLEVIKRGEANGWKKIYANTVYFPN